MHVLEQPSPALKEAQERRGRRTLEPSRSLQAKYTENGGLGGSWVCLAPCGLGEVLCLPVAQTLFGRLG